MKDINTKTTLLTKLILVAGFFCPWELSGQNLVPNGGFEEGVNCPTFIANLDAECNNWFASIIPEDDLHPTPDWFHECSEFENLSPPEVAFGTQAPFEGGGYAGIITYRRVGPPDTHREIIGVELLDPLIVGYTYLVELYVSTLHNPEFAIESNNLGFNFSTHPFYNNDAFPTNSSHYAMDTILRVSSDWSLISELFVADSNYRYLHIGNFYDDANTEIVTDELNHYETYCVIDQVSVSSTLTNSPPLSKGQIKLYPNPARGVINLIAPLDEKIQSIFLVDALGKICSLHGQKNHVSEEFEIKIDDLQPGCYTIFIETPKSKYYEKFIKVR